jgi:hypothetical protein
MKQIKKRFMNKMTIAIKTKFLLIIFILYLLSQGLFAQDSLVNALARQNLTMFSERSGEFKGPGWEQIVTNIKRSNYVLIGEDHFTNEIPVFAAAIAKEGVFDNYFCEVDPFSTQIIVDKIAMLSAIEMKEFVLKYQNTFSFFAFEPEFKLLQQLVKAKTAIIGTEQIFLLADRFVCSELKKVTGNTAAKTIYEKIELQSLDYLNKYLKNQKQPFYMLTDEFEQNLNTLLSLALSAKETSVLLDMKRSRKIYMEQNHALRIQLMKSQLMEHIPALTTQKNLFKYGAVHMPKGESLLRIYDLGNLVSNIADSRFEKSFHILIVGKNGKAGSPFEGFPPNELDPENGDLKFLKPFFKEVNGTDYHCFDLSPIRQQVEKGKLEIKDKWLLRSIMGYDYLVVIPTVTPAVFSFHK